MQWQVELVRLELNELSEKSINDTNTTLRAGKLCVSRYSQFFKADVTRETEVL